MLWLLLACHREPVDEPALVREDVLGLCHVLGSCAADDCERALLAERLQQSPMETAWGRQTRDALAEGATSDRFDPAAHDLAVQVMEVDALHDLDCALIVALWGEP